MRTAKIEAKKTLSNGEGIKVAYLLAVCHATGIDIPAFDEIVCPVMSHGRGYCCRWIRENQTMQNFGILAAHLVLVVSISGPRFTTLRFLFILGCADSDRGQKRISRGLGGRTTVNLSDVAATLCK